MSAVNRDRAGVYQEHGLRKLRFNLMEDGGNWELVDEGVNGACGDLRLSRVSNGCVGTHPDVEEVKLLEILHYEIGQYRIARLVRLEHDALFDVSGRKDIGVTVFFSTASSILCPHFFSPSSPSRSHCSSIRSSSFAVYSSTASTLGFPSTVTHSVVVIEWWLIANK